MKTTTLTAAVSAGPDKVFATLTDPVHLPVWNTAIRRLVRGPDQLGDGAEWVVELHVLGRTWHSRSQVQTFDPDGRTFAYRSQTDGGNPSYAEWRWTVAEQPDGSSLVSVTFTLHPKTFWRRVLFVHVRQRQLAAQELPTSLAALSTAAKASVAGG